MDRKDIESLSTILSNSIKDFSESKKEYWQKVPHMALEANGRTGFNESHTATYRSGFWQVGGFINSTIPMFVDLGSGKLVSSSSHYSYQRDHSQILESPLSSQILILATNLDLVDGKKVLESLEQKSKEPYDSFYDPKEQKEQREFERDHWNVREIFKRS